MELWNICPTMNYLALETAAFADDRLQVEVGLAVMVDLFSPWTDAS